MTVKGDVVKILKDWGFIVRTKKTRDYPYYGDRFTAYRRGTASDYNKARAAYIKKYGKRSWERDIQPVIRGDKMGVFWQKPTKKSVYFINRLAWSSEKRIRESGKLGKIVQRGFR